MDAIEKSAAIDRPGFASAVEKALNGDVPFLRKLLKARASRHKADGETPQQAFAKAFSGRDPRDAQGARLFSMLVNLEKVAPLVPSDTSPAVDLTPVDDNMTLDQLAHAYAKETQTSAVKQKPSKLCCALRQAGRSGHATRRALPLVGDRIAGATSRKSAGRKTSLNVSGAVPVSPGGLSPDGEVGRCRLRWILTRDGMSADDPKRTWWHTLRIIEANGLTE